jgi:hypothetical protein
VAYSLRHLFLNAAIAASRGDSQSGELAPTSDLKTPFIKDDERKAEGSENRA